MMKKYLKNFKNIKIKRYNIKTNDIEEIKRFDKVSSEWFKNKNLI